MEPIDKNLPADSLPETEAAEVQPDESVMVEPALSGDVPPTAISDEAASTEAASDESEKASSQDAASGTYRGINILKFWLMPFVCFASFGFPGPYGAFVSRLSLFAPIAFYILCGFLLSAKEKDDPDIYKRLMKRSARQFALIFVILVIMNGVLLGATGMFGEAASQIFRKRTLFNIIVLCTWPFPIGETIWFIQSLLYARIILFFMNKYGLMKHYKKVLAATALFAVLFGEFAGIIHFDFHGYTSIPGNAITRAIPYMLLGRLLYEKRDALLTRPSWNYCLAFLVGIFASIGEIMLLSRIGLLVYTGHMIGYGIMAFSACCLFLKMKDVEKNFFVIHGRSYSWRIYVLSQPVGNLLLLWAGFVAPTFYVLMQVFGGIIVYPVCLAICFGIGYVRHLVREEKRMP